MRKFLVKHFVLDYIVKIFGKYRNAPRASRIIFPTFVITGYAISINDNFPTPTPFIWFMLGLTAISLYLGFAHFKFFPIKWDELDDLQKYQYVQAGKNITQEQFDEYQKILVKLKKKYPELW